MKKRGTAKNHSAAPYSAPREKLLSRCYVGSGLFTGEVKASEVAMYRRFTAPLRCTPSAARETLGRRPQPDSCGGRLHRADQPRGPPSKSKRGAQLSPPWEPSPTGQAVMQFPSFEVLFSYL